MNSVKNIIYVFKSVSAISSKMIVCMFAWSVIAAAESLVNLFLIKFVIDFTVSKAFDITKLFEYMLLYFLLMVMFKILKEIVLERAINKGSFALETYYLSKVYQKSAEINIINFERSEFYDKLDRTINKIGSCYLQILSLTCSLFINIIGFLAVFTIYFDFVLLAAVIINVTMYLAYHWKHNKRNYEFNKKEEKFYRYEGYLDRVFSDRAFAQELRVSLESKDMLLKKYTIWWENFTEDFKAYIRKYTVSTILWQQTGRDLIYAASSIYVTFLLFKNEITIGDFLVLISIVATMSTDLINVLKVIPELHQSGLFVSEIREILNFPTDLDNDQSLMPVHCFKKLAAHDLSFQYNDKDRFQIHNLSFSINQNEIIALAGLNGSGKTTIVDLILGLLKPDAGRIELNGENYRDYKRSDVKKLFGVVFQDFQIYEISIAENILMHEVVTQEDRDLVEEALKYVDLYDKAVLLDDGIYTILSSDKQNSFFSGGEQQMLAIARAYACKTPVIIFDEPTSALDVFITNQFFTKLMQLRDKQNKTIVFVSHKLKYVSMADKILFIHDGTIAEAGSHDELIKRNGKYADLYRTKHVDLFSEG